MIVIAGATGRLGTLVTTRLAGRGLQVRALTREPSRARHLSGIASEVVTCDIRDRASLDAGTAGATVLVSAVQGFAGPGRGSPDTVDREGNANLIEAALAVDADVVLMSVIGASPESPMELFRAKYAAEQYLRASGARWTIVRAAAFVELWAEIMRKPIVFGRGDNPINFVSVADVASAVERAVIDASWRQQVMEVAGPRDLTFNELAMLLQQVRQQPAKVRHVPPWLIRSMSSVSRKARAAVAMDTLDMTYVAGANRPGNGELQMTDVQTALTQGLSERD